MHKNRAGNPPAEPHTYRPDTPHTAVEKHTDFPQKNRKNPSTTTGLSHRKRRFCPRISQKTPSGEDFHNPPGRNPEVHHRNRQEEEPENPCRACIFRFSTVSRPLLLLLLDRRDKKTDGRTERACARGKTDRKRRTTFPDAPRRTEERRRENVAVPESPARTHIY